MFVIQFAFIGLVENYTRLVVGHYLRGFLLSSVGCAREIYFLYGLIFESCKKGVVLEENSVW